MRHQFSIAMSILLLAGAPALAQQGSRFNDRLMFDPNSFSGARQLDAPKQASPTATTGQSAPPPATRQAVAPPAAAQPQATPKPNRKPSRNRPPGLRPRRAPRRAGRAPDRRRHVGRHHQHGHRPAGAARGNQPRTLGYSAGLAGIRKPDPDADLRHVGRPARARLRKHPAQQFLVLRPVAAHADRSGSSRFLAVRPGQSRRQLTVPPRLGRRRRQGVKARQTGGRRTSHGQTSHRIR